jgi:branched-chain amino acid transport system permease protein
MLEFLQYVLDGLATGGLYALIAVGYSMVYGVLQMINFAHGELFMVGAYFVMVVLGAGAPAWAAIPFCALGLGLFAVVIERVAYRPLRNADRLAPLITAVGVSLFLQYAVQLIFSPNPRSYPVQLPSDLVELFDGEIIVRVRDIGIFVLTVVLTLCLELFVRKTRPGQGIRALAMHPMAARFVGVPINRTIALTFFIGAALACVAGSMQGMAVNQIGPYMGVTTGLKAFAAAVLGGIGVLPGALLGGLVLGITENLLVGYELSTYKDGSAFLILILVLLIRPQGLLGSTRLVKV